MLSNIEMAKAQIALHADFWISLTAKLEWIPDENFPALAGTNGKSVTYNPKLMKDLTLPEVIGLVLHETGHCLLAHPARIGARDKEMANIAMDVVLNQTLQKYFADTPTLKAALPKGGIYGPHLAKYEGWNWEKVYADLQECKQQGKKMPGNLQDYVDPGVNDDGTPMTPDELETLAKDWTMAAQQAATMAKKRGNLPGCMEELVSDMIKPRVNWAAQLPEEFKKISKDDMSWRRLNRRHLHEELFLPGMYSEQVGRVVFGVDTSGSMDSREFTMAMGAMNEILMDVKPTDVYLIECDTRVVHEEIITPDDLPVVAKPFKGRGGTHLTPIFQRIQELDVEPELVVVLSDGEFETIDKKYQPNCNTVWLITTASTQAADSSFGRVIRVEV